jgi:type I restriction enzyme S subunit
MIYKSTIIGRIPENWKTISVEDLIKYDILEQPLDGNHGDRHPKQNDFGKEGIPFITASDITTDGKLDFKQCKLLKKDKVKDLRKGFSKEGDVLLTHKGTLGRSVVVKNLLTKYIILSPQVTYYRIKNKNELNNIYLKYYFTYDNFKKLFISWGGSGSTRLYIGINAQRKLPVIVPSIEEQEKIASILSSLDNKIELNSEINKKLEQIAQAIFKHWFIDFEFPNENGEPYKSSGGEMIESELGLIPKEWNVRSLNQIANFLNGLAMQKYRPKNDESHLPVLKIKELKIGKTSKNSDKCSVNIDPKYIVDNGDVVFSWSGSLEVKLWCGNKAGLNQHLFKVTSANYPKWFYYYWTKHHIGDFRRIAEDKTTTMGHIKREHLKKAKVSDPGKIFFEKFDKVFNGLIDLYINKEKEIKYLSLIRDILLPKLMSGEIRVPTNSKVLISKNN